MKALIQRVAQASVSVEGTTVGSCKQGFLILLGVGHRDTSEHAQYLWNKISKLRIFEDEQGKTNCSLHDIEGEVLIVSQFTLMASCKKGNRPSFGDAAQPDHAQRLYEEFLELAQRDVSRVESGVFGAFMQIELVNDGPFTVMLDTDDLMK